MKNIIAFGSDHVGYELKNEIIRRLGERYGILDAGPLAYDPADDYADYAEAAARAVADGRAWRAILICGSGVGVCVAANKVPGVRACVCHDTFSAHQGVEHVNVNALCLGARVIGIELAWELVNAYVNASFSSEERHRRRLDKVMAIEQRYAGGVH